MMADRYWWAYIDGSYVTRVVFTSDVTPERNVVAQHDGKVNTFDIAKLNNHWNKSW